MMERPYYMDYSPARLVIHKMVTSKYFDLAISAVIGLNVITMAMEFYMMPSVSPDMELLPANWLSAGAGVHSENIQLLLHWDLHNRGLHEDLGTRLAKISFWQVESYT